MSITGLIFFGDSILAGTGASERELGCAKLVKGALSLPVSFKARNWNTSEDGLKRIQEDVLSRPELSHVVILFGNNDSWITPDGKTKVPLAQMKQNLLQMVQMIQNNKQTPILCNLQPIDTKKLFQTHPELLGGQNIPNNAPAILQDRYSKTIESLATEMNLAFLDLRTELTKYIDDVVADDGLHPNDKGHKIIAQRILGILKKIAPAINLSSEYSHILAI